MPGVRLLGLTIDTRSDQFGLYINGDVPGLLVDQVTFRKRSRQAGQQVWSHVLARAVRGTREAPARIRRSTFESWINGMVVDGFLQECGHLAIEDCRFLGGFERHLELIGLVHDTRITGNIFAESRDGVYLDKLGHSGNAGHIAITNNSFFRIERWLEPTSSSADLPGMVVANNALVAVEALDAPDGRLDDLATGGWRFARNLWEADPGPGSPVAERVPDLGLRSREPSSLDFLRPSPVSPLIGTGVGGDLPGDVGALPPDTEDR